MKNFFVIFVAAFMLSTFIFIMPVFAIPSLQLDIKNGTYDTTTKTIVASKDKFTLYAYLIPDCNASLDDKYYISAALSPQVNIPSDLGSFSFAERDTIVVTEDLILGTPPVDTLYAGQGADPGDLSPHGIFPTYFMEYSFTFDESHKAVAYNTQDNPGIGPIPDSNGGMYYHAFEVDTSLIDYPYVVHFDLYNTQINAVTTNETNKKCTVNKKGKLVCRNVINEVLVGSDVDIKSFAPFSHDAESRQVPEPSTILLLGTGLIGLGLWGRRRIRA